LKMRAWTWGTAMELTVIYRSDDVVHYHVIVKGQVVREIVTYIKGENPWTLNTLISWSENDFRDYRQNGHV
jgi:hypothetical protein